MDEARAVNLRREMISCLKGKRDNEILACLDRERRE